MTSPYLLRESERLGIGSRADFRRDVFPRTQSDTSAEWIKTERIYSKLEIAIAWALIIVSGCAALRIAVFVYDVVIARGVLQ